MKKLIFIFTIICSIYAFDAEAMLKNIPGLSGYFDNNKTLKYELPQSTLDMYESQLSDKDKWLVNAYKEEIKLQKNPVIKDTIFHFVSNSVPLANIGNTLIAVSKLKDKYPNFEYRNIYAGIAPDTMDRLLDINIYLDKNLSSKYATEMFYMKIDPSIFKDLNITEVPALAFAECKNDDIYPSDCDIKYLVRGDITLDYFFSLIGEKEPRLKEYYHELVENNSKY